MRVPGGNTGGLGLVSAPAGASAPPLGLATGAIGLGHQLLVRMSTAELTTLDVDGQHLRVAVQPGVEAGRPPLLLLNGLGANLEIFQPFVDALGERIGSLRIDLPGVGGSPPSAIPLRMSGLARLLARALERLDFAEVDVLGISWGGTLAQQFAHQYTHRCRRLVLVSTGTGAFMVPGRPTALLMLASPRRYVDPAYMASVAPHLYGGRMRSHPELAMQYVRSSWSAEPRGYYAQLLAGAGWTSIHWLWRLRQPTLILSGRDDPIVPWINGWIMARLIRDSRLHIFDDGHLGLLTSAAELAPIVRTFLTQ
jgi:poly(3-hydroxyalkanoate) depolymerase